MISHTLQGKFVDVLQETCAFEKKSCRVILKSGIMTTNSIPYVMQIALLIGSNT